MSGIAHTQAPTGRGCTNVSSASDILLYDAAATSGIEVESNVLGNSQIPIAWETYDEYGAPENGNGVTVSSNKVFGTGYYDAIDVCTNNNTVTGNTIFNSAESGVHLDAGWRRHWQQQRRNRKHHPKALVPAISRNRGQPTPVPLAPTTRCHLQSPAPPPRAPSLRLEEQLHALGLRPREKSTPPHKAAKKKVSIRKQRRESDSRFPAFSASALTASAKNPPPRTTARPAPPRPLQSNPCPGPEYSRDVEATS